VQFVSCGPAFELDGRPEEGVGVDLARMYHWIVSELAQHRPVAESMRRLIDQCEAACPHPNWARLRALPYADLGPLVRWVERPFLEEPPVRPLKGLWFGLFNPIRDGEAVADIYLAGSERFEPTNIHWAVRPEWWPAARYAESAVTAGIYRIGRQPGGPSVDWDLGNDAEYPLCLGYGAFAVREVLSRVGPALVLGESPSVEVGVGFDSGDWIRLGEFGLAGFTE
jgi:hypothetical protein